MLPLQLVCAIALAAAPADHAENASASAGAVAEIQRELVAHLTGHEPWHGQRGGPRSSAGERAAAADLLEARLREIGLEPQRHAYRMPNANGFVDLLLAPYRGTNVYAVLEAQAPDRPYVVVGAHYDTVPGSPGAVDNASGVALVVGLAASLRAHQSRRLNYLFVLFDQEEDDEVGSRAFARMLAGMPIRVHSVHIADLVGWDEDGDRAIEVQSPGPMLERAYRDAAARVGVPIAITRGASSDNKSFLAAGYATAGVWEEWDHGDSTPHLHAATDTFETVDFGFLGSTTALMYEVLTQLDSEAAHGAP